MIMGWDLLSNSKQASANKQPPNFYKFNFAFFVGEIRYDFERYRSLANWKYVTISENSSTDGFCFMILSLVRLFARFVVTLISISAAWLGRL